MNVKNKVAFITGAGGGIGRGIALALAKRSCHLALADKDNASLGETVEQISRYGVKVSAHVLDVTNKQAVNALPATLNEIHGDIDLLINNAGIASGGTFLQVSEDVYDRVLAVNFHAVVHITRVFLPYLQKRSEARIVNISSLYGLVAPIEQTAYAASKFAVRGFSNALRHELEGSPVGVTVVHPGGVATGIAQNASIPAGVTATEIQQRQKMMKKLLRMPPEKAGEIIVKGIEKNKARVLVGADAKLIALIERLMPVHYWNVLKALAKLRAR